MRRWPRAAREVARGAVDHAAGPAYGIALLGTGREAEKTREFIGGSRAAAKLCRCRGFAAGLAAGRSAGGSEGRAGTVDLGQLGVHVGDERGGLAVVNAAKGVVQQLVVAHVQKVARVVAVGAQVAEHRAERQLDRVELGGVGREVVQLGAGQLDERLERALIIVMQPVVPTVAAGSQRSSSDSGGSVREQCARTLSCPRPPPSMALGTVAGTAARSCRSSQESILC